MIKILFLVETGHGMGHITRSLILAQTFKKKYNIVPFFLFKGNKGIKKVKYNKESLVQNPSPKIIINKINKFKPNIFIIDILDANSKILKMIDRKKMVTVVIFDFFFKKPISADVIVNPNINMINYKSNNSKCLLGPKYAILGNYFKKNTKKIKKKVNSVIISMGGSDPKDYTSQTIKALKNFNLNVDVIIGPLSKNKEKIKKKLSKLNNFNFKSDITNKKMSKLMLRNDILLSTAGNTIYEAASIGLPNIVFCNHQRHNEIAVSFDKMGIVINLGIKPKINIIKNAVYNLINNPKKRNEMSSLDKKLVDNKGAERIIKVIFKKYKLK